MHFSLLRITKVQDGGLIFIAMKIQPRSYAFVVNNSRAAEKGEQEGHFAPGPHGLRGLIIGEF